MSEVMDKANNESKLICQAVLAENSDLADSRKSYRRGEVIFQQGARVKGVYCVLKGKVKIGRWTDTGKEKIVRLAGENDVIGYRSLLSGSPYHATGVALDDTLVAFVPSDTFIRMIDTNPAISGSVIRLLCKDLDESEIRQLDMATKNVRSRLAEVIVQLMETYGLNDDSKTLSVRLKREDLAALVGAAKEVVIRMLSSFKDEGIISSKGRALAIENLPALKKIAGL